MTYFRNCRTIEDVKRTYRDLAKKLHPDCGGNAEEFKKMSAEYQTAFNRYKNIHESKKEDSKTDQQETYTKETTETPEQFAEIINAIIGLAGLKIEIIGSWVWVSGNTFIHKDALKAAGFTWSKSKKAWYHAGEKLQGKRRGRYSMNGLRMKWGTQEVKNDSPVMLTA